MSVQQLLKKPEDDAEIVFNSYKEAADEDPRERGKVFVTESLTTFFSPMIEVQNDSVVNTMV